MCKMDKRCPICKQKDTEALSQLYLAAVLAIQKDNRHERDRLQAENADLRKRLEHYEEKP